MAVAFAAILVIMIVASRVLTPVIGTYVGFAEGDEFKPLRDFLEHDASPLQQEANSAADLAKKYKIAEAAQLAAWQEHQANENDDDRKKALKRAEATYKVLDGTVMSVTSLGLLLYMRQRFRRVMQIVYGGILVAGICATAFAYLTNPPADAKTEEPAKKHKMVAQVQPVTCARYYLTLAELAYHEPDISKHWLAHSLDSQATTCGLGSETAVAHFLTYLERTWRVNK